MLAKPYIALVWLAAASAAHAGGPEKFRFAQKHMGTAFEIVVVAQDATAASKAADAAFARIAQLNSIMSDYDADSELSRLSRASGGPGRAIGDDLYAVLERSRHFSARSGGAFDVTVGPVVKLWRRARATKRMPRPERLAEALAAVGADKIILDPAARTARLTAPRMRLDLGGIAKGYAADEALKVLRTLGLGAALINAGGDVTTGDAPPGTDGWAIALRPQGVEPTADTGPLLLANASVATSGDIFRYVEINGTRYSHIVDPKTGLGLTTRVGVSVVAPDGTTADALASAISVLGPKRGLALADQVDGVAAIVTRLKPGGAAEVFRSKRASALRFAPPPTGGGIK